MAGQSPREDEGTTFNQRQGQPVISLDVHPRQSGFDHSPISNETRTETPPVPQRPFTSNNTMQRSSCQMPPSLCSSSWSDIPSHALPMNILPSLPEPRINNTNIPVAYAEQQPSFRTTSTVSSPLSPITRGAEGQPPHQGQMYNGMHQSNLSYLSGMFSLFPPVSSEDNSQNISVSPSLGHPPMTARPMCTNFQMGLANGNVRGQASGGPGDYGRQISHSSSTSSMKSFINDDSPVRKLSNKILSHIALTLQCKQTSASWKELVGKYGWDYDRTYLFENKLHPGYIFLSLLQEPEFQEYSLEQLRQDLFELPRKDILADLNEMINDHNTVASGRTAQNQLT
jgi:hypothetical protein